MFIVKCSCGGNLLQRVDREYSEKIGKRKQKMLSKNVILVCETCGKEYGNKKTSRSIH